MGLRSCEAGLCLRHPGDHVAPVVSHSSSSQGLSPCRLSSLCWFLLAKALTSVPKWKLYLPLSWTGTRMPRKSPDFQPCDHSPASLLWAVALCNTASGNFPTTHVAALSICNYSPVESNTLMVCRCRQNTHIGNIHKHINKRLLTSRLLLLFSSLQ